jgi:hypothetical protein
VENEDEEDSFGEERRRTHTGCLENEDEEEDSF